MLSSDTSRSDLRPNSTLKQLWVAAVSFIAVAGAGCRLAGDLGRAARRVQLRAEARSDADATYTDETQMNVFAWLTSRAVLRLRRHCFLLGSLANSLPEPRPVPRCCPSADQGLRSQQCQAQQPMRHDSDLVPPRARASARGRRRRLIRTPKVVPEETCTPRPKSQQGPLGLEQATASALCGTLGDMGNVLDCSTVRFIGMRTLPREIRGVILNSSVIRTN